MNNETHIIILAAGNGTRMKSTMPKALTPLHGRPIISFVIDAVQTSGVCDTPTIVVGPDNGQVIKDAIGDDFHFRVQEEQLGTGHAVAVCREELEGVYDTILVLYCDMPLISPETIQKLTETHKRSGATLSLATTTVPDFSDWRAGFESFSRIVRDRDGTLVRSVERKDATDEELSIREVNPAYLCFDASWMWTALTKMKRGNAQNEYYLTDLVKFAVDQGKVVETVSIPPEEALGINTQDQLALVRELTK